MKKEAFLSYTLTMKLKIKQGSDGYEDYKKVKTEKLLALNYMKVFIS